MLINVHQLVFNFENVLKFFDFFWKFTKISLIMTKTFVSWSIVFQFWPTFKITKIQRYQDIYLKCVQIEYAIVFII